MLNEIIFLLEIFILFLCTLFAAKRGEVYLGALICLEAVLANLFVLKQITLFGLHVTASDSLAVGSVISLSVFQENFGKKSAKKVATLSLLVLIFFAISSYFHLCFVPSSYDVANSHYLSLLATSPRITLASLFAFYFSQKIDVTIFAFLKNRLPNLSLGYRSAFSTSFAQTIDTFCFSFLGLYGIVNHIWHIIFLSLIIKLLSIFFFSSFLLFFNKTFKKAFRAPS